MKKPIANLRADVVKAAMRYNKFIHAVCAGRIASYPFCQQEQLLHKACSALAEREKKK